MIKLDPQLLKNCLLKMYWISNPKARNFRFLDNISKKKGRVYAALKRNFNYLLIKSKRLGPVVGGHRVVSRQRRDYLTMFTFLYAARILVRTRKQTSSMMKFNL